MCPPARHVSSRASVPAHGGTWTGGSEGGAEASCCVSHTTPGPRPQSRNQDSRGVRCDEEEESPSSGSFRPAASDGLFRLESHLPLCCNGFKMVCPSAPVPPTPTRLRFSWDGRRDGRRLEETQERSVAGARPSPHSIVGEPNLPRGSLGLRGDRPSSPPRRSVGSQPDARFPSQPPPCAWAPGGKTAQSLAVAVPTPTPSCGPEGRKTELSRTEADMLGQRGGGMRVQSAQ